MIEFERILDFYKGKSVFITGNTGFKGAWITYILLKAGAHVTGYSLKPPTDPALFDIIGLERASALNQIYADVRDLDTMKDIFFKSTPSIVIHLAAQPIVRESYRNPVGTYTTNVIGTVNICECIRLSESVRSFLNVTTDKVYRNNEWEWGYREDEYLDGYDPYSNSKSCSELVTAAYRRSFFSKVGEKNNTPSGQTTPIIGISTARAGNVIGGGDFSADRIIPDCIRAIENGETYVKLRSSLSIRPYQHVLESIFAYLMIVMQQYDDSLISGSFNVGPDECDCVCTSKLMDIFCNEWNKEPATDYGRLLWRSISEDSAPHEANFLKLDNSRIKSIFGWQPRWNIVDAIRHTVSWNRVWMSGEDVRNEMDNEIQEYISG